MPGKLSQAHRKDLKSHFGSGQTFEPLQPSNYCAHTHTHTDTIENKASLGFLQHIALSVLLYIQKESKECSLLTDLTGWGYSQKGSSVKKYFVRTHHDQFIGVALEQHYGCIRGRLKPQAQWEYVFSSCFAFPSLKSFTVYLNINHF